MVFKVRLLNVVLRIVSVSGGLTLPGLMMMTRQISLKCRPPYSLHHPPCMEK